MSTSRIDLSRGGMLRPIILGVGSVAAVLILTQFLLPGSAGAARGTPAAILFSGIVTGALNGLTAIGLVLIYRTSRVVNFAQAALGAAGAIFAYNLIIVYRFNYILAFLAAIIFSAAIGAIVELFLRRFFEAPRLVYTIVTIGLATLLGAIGVQAVAGIPIWGEQRDLAATFGQTEINPLPDFSFTLGDLQVPFGAEHLLAIGFLFAAMLGIGWFLRYTRLGMAIRASSENAERAELLGVNVRILSTTVWVIAGGLAGAGLTLLGTTQSFALGGQGAPSVLIAALAAAVIARMRSLPIAVLAALLISVFQRAIGWSFQDDGGLVEAALLGVIIIGLLAQRRTLARAQEASSWESHQEVRPTPFELQGVSSVRTWRRVLVGLAVAFVLGFPWTTESGLVNRASYAALLAMVLLSLVVLTGWAGQVSLGQFGFVAIGAMVGAALTSRAGISFWLALPIAATITAMVAIIVGIPALRIRGLFLGVVTLAFASTVGLVLFEERYFGWLEPRDIRRPTLPFLDFEDERSMYYLSLLFLGLTVMLVVALRRSRPGRVLIALRENENDLQAFGINVVRTKLSAFALSGFICGVAGVLIAHHQRAVGAQAFGPQASLDTFVFAVIGGVGSVTGAMLGSAFQAASQSFPQSDPILAFFLNPATGLLVIMYMAPGGLASLVYGLRDSVYRIVAQRRQIIVPSLMADYDPVVAARQLIPLADPLDDAGLASLGLARRYKLTSELYQQAELSGEGGAPDDRTALGAAAQRASGEA